MHGIRLAISATQSLDRRNSRNVQAWIEIVFKARSRIISDIRLPVVAPKLDGIQMLEIELEN